MLEKAVTKTITAIKLPAIDDWKNKMPEHTQNRLVGNGIKGAGAGLLGLALLIFYPEHQTLKWVGISLLVLGAHLFSNGLLKLALASIGQGMVALAKGISAIVRAFRGEKIDDTVPPEEPQP